MNSVKSFLTSLFTAKERSIFFEENESKEKRKKAKRLKS
jgi:hypothetical protein